MQLDLLGHDVQAERAARDRGMKQAADHADKACVLWSTTALDFFIDYVATAKGPFMTEDVRKAAELSGITAPPDRRAWGSVTIAVANRKLIKRIGYGPQTSAGCHMAPKSIWRRA